MTLPLMQKATAVWLIDNTKLTFSQIAKFCGLHELEVNGIADGEVANGIRGMDPISNTQLTLEEIKRCENDETAELVLLKNPASIGEGKRRGPRYTPLSKRQDRPSAIAWIVKFHPELPDSKISKLIGTTKPTIQSIRARTHWNMANIQPVDPVALGLCKQVELDSVVAKFTDRPDKEEITKKSQNEEIIVSTEKSLIDNDNKVPSNIAGLEDFSLTGVKNDDEATIDPNELFSLPGEEKD